MDLMVMFLSAAILSLSATTTFALPFCHGCYVMENFFSVNLGNVLTIASFLAGGLAFVYTIRTDVKIQAERMTLMQEMNASRLSSLEIQIRTLSDVLVDLAKQSTRLDMLEQQVMELRRGG
jgi:hypothetical protein